MTPSAPYTLTNQKTDLAIGNKVQMVVRVETESGTTNPVAFHTCGYVTSE